MHAAVKLILSMHVNSVQKLLLSLHSEVHRVIQFLCSVLLFDRLCIRMIIAIVHDSYNLVQLTLYIYMYASYCNNKIIAI